MKTKEKLNVLNEKINSMNENLTELDEKEEELVTGGEPLPGSAYKYSVGMVFKKREGDMETSFTIRTRGIDYNLPAYFGPLVVKNERLEYQSVLDNNKCFGEQELISFFRDDSIG